MPLGMEVGPGLRDIVFDVDPATHLVEGVMHVGNREGSEFRSKVSCEKDLGVWISNDMNVLSSACMPLIRPLEYWV